MTTIHHINFVKVNHRWIAQVFTDKNTCVSWQTVGNRRAVDAICKGQLTNLNIPFTVEV